MDKWLKLKLCCCGSSEDEPSNQTLKLDRTRNGSNHSIRHQSIEKRRRRLWNSSFLCRVYQVLMIRVGAVPLLRSPSPKHSCTTITTTAASCKRPISADSSSVSIRRKKIVTNTSPEAATGLKVFVLSDLHTDYPDNMAWVQSIPATRRKNDVLLVAGDVAETYANFVSSMNLLKNKFKSVFFVPGNHDLWCRREDDKYVDSLEKLKALLDACKRLGVRTDPMAVQGLGIIPLLSWYHESFDREQDITGFHIPSLEMACKDFHACKWPEKLSKRDDALSVYFDNMNEKNKALIEEIRNTCRQLITFSHFLPRQELCPEKRMLFYPNLHKIIGSDLLEDRIRSVIGTEGSPSACHVFGHTHFCWDAVLDGIRYVQAPLAYPRERKRRMNGGEDWLPFCVYSNGKFSDRLNPCYWSDYYSVNPRDPTNTQLAPWVARFYRRP